VEVFDPASTRVTQLLKNVLASYRNRTFSPVFSRALSQMTQVHAISAYLTSILILPSHLGLASWVETGVHLLRMPVFRLFYHPPYVEYLVG
jgi:hypothetical protein